MREHRTWRRLARAILTALLGLALGASLCSCGDGGMDSRQAQEQGSGQLAAAAAQEDLSFSARVEYGRLETDLRLVRREGDWEVQVVNPEALRDMAFWFHQDRLTVRYKGAVL